MRTAFSTIKKHMSFANADHVVDDEEAEALRIEVLKSLANFFNSMGSCVLEFFHFFSFLFVVVVAAAAVPRRAFSAQLSLACAGVRAYM